MCLETGRTDRSEALSLPPQALFFVRNFGAASHSPRAAAHLQLRARWALVPTLARQQGRRRAYASTELQCHPQRRGRRGIAYNTAVIAFCGYNAGAPHSGKFATAAICPYSTSPRPSLDRPSLGLLSSQSTRPKCGRLVSPTRWPWLLQDH